MELKEPLPTRNVPVKTALGIGIMGLVIATTLPITIPLNFVLKKFGRKGFFRDNGGKVWIIIDQTSFQKA